MLRAATRVVGPIAIALATLSCDRLPTAPARPGAGPLRAITLVDWSAEGYGRPAAEAALEALAATGATGVTLIVTAYQASPSASAIRADDPRTPSAMSMRRAADQARALGLEIAIKPHVDLDDGSWRGAIEPADAPAWFASYRDFLLRWAAFADSVGAGSFVVGTELAGTVRHQREWSEIIRATRAVFHGRLVYAASWDEADRVPFWRQLDLVGVDAYFPVAGRRSPGRLELLAGWQSWLARLERLHRKTGRPVLLTEIGYRSVDGAAMNPFEFTNDEAIDLAEQADLYWAALEATNEADWLAGLWWWNWPADGSGGAASRDYTPRGKPAEDELRSAWGGER